MSDLTTKQTLLPVFQSSVSPAPPGRALGCAGVLAKAAVAVGAQHLHTQSGILCDPGEHNSLVLTPQVFQGFQVLFLAHFFFFFLSRHLPSFSV